MRIESRIRILDNEHDFVFCLSFKSVANRPNFLGLFGQGLYDFLNGFLGYGNNPSSGGSTSGPTSGTVLADQQSGGNENRPVYEVNVPDTIQALVRLLLLLLFAIGL